MSAGGSSEETGGQDFEINLAPIIDCFTVLIIYLLVSASFISLAIFDVGIATSNESASTQSSTKEIPVNVIIRLNNDSSVTIKVSGGTRNVDLSFNYPQVSNKWNIVGVSKKLKEIVVEFPTIKDATITAEASVRYKNIVEVIENLRKSVPKLYIGS
jgi:biopolymer transport protein ExbD